MTKKLLNKPTATVDELAKKYGVSVLQVKKQLMKGIKVEKEHTNQTKIAREIALDHLGERLDYYTKLDKANLEEQNGVGGIRGLGYTSGDPTGTNYVQQYIDTNAMSYQDDNGSKLDFIKKKHVYLHNKGLGYNFFDPTNIKSSSNFMKEEKLNELGGMVGYEGINDKRSLRTNDQLEEGPLKDKAKKIAMAGITAANMYTMADVAGRATEGGRGSPKGDVVRAASALPGAVGWGATAVHYGKKGYDLAKDALKKKKAHMEEEKKMSNPCWKGYKAYGMKKKNGKEVPNCVPVEENVEESAAWQRKAGKNPEGGLNRKGIASYRRENPGSKLSMAVTTEPSKLDPDSKPAKRRKSFCARMGGMKGPMKDEKGRPTRKALALRKWNCEEENNALPQSTQRGIYEKAPPGAKYERMVRHIKDKLGADGLTDKEKGIAFATTWKAYNKKHMEESQIDEISDDLVGRASNAAFWKGKAPSERLSRYINRAYTRQPEKKDKKETKPKKPVKENMHDKDWDEATGKLPEQKETKMENNNLVNEAIENILDNNLNEMKENLMVALQEKAQEKLEEKKKIIASEYFAQ